LRIVTLNTWKNEGAYPERLALMAGRLADLAADIVCLQECFAWDRADTAAHLAAALGLHATILPARRKVRRHDGRDVMSSSGLAVLSRRAPDRHDQLALPSDRRDGERVALRADLAGNIRVLNLHLTHLADTADLRARQLATAIAWARTGWSGSLMVCGDLNCGRGDPEFAALEATAGAEIGSTLHARPEGRAIDHAILLADGGLRVRQCTRALDLADAAGRFPSDHAAVVLDLES
jgi:endonuclease/exonuclease/phosphatase family metal-dependent hydrolase